MSVKMMARVWELDVKANEQIVLLALADHADDDGYNVRPSVKRVAWKTGTSADTARRVMHKLTDDGILVKVKDVPGRPSIYRLDFSKAAEKPPFEPETPSNLRGAKESDPSQIASPPLAKLCKPTPSKTVQGETSSNHQEPSSSADAANPEQDKDDDLKAEHKAFMEGWHTSYAEAFGVDYVFQGAKDGAAVKRLLRSSKMDAEALLGIAAAAWKRPTLFNCKQAASIAGFASRFNEIRGELRNGKPKSNLSKSARTWGEPLPEGVTA